MRYICLLLTLFSIHLSAQEFKEVFLGDNYQYYKGALFKVNPKMSTSPYIVLSKTLEGAKKMVTSKEDILFATDMYTSNFDTMKYKTFIVEDFFKYYRPVFALRDVNTDELAYFSYDIIHEFKFPFIVKLKTSEQDIIKEQISKTIDDFTGEITIHSPFYNVDESHNDVIFYKKIKGASISYYLSLESLGYTPDVMEKGVIILFDDGTKISKPNADIEIEVNESSSIPYRYSAFIKLTQIDIKKLREKVISKYRLYIHDNHFLNKEEPELIRTYINHVIESK